ncbi:Uncharacterised protein [Bordetella pertussis]|nr:Uncharacterised protein [Bordetella pertussis]
MRTVSADLRPAAPASARRKRHRLASSSFSRMQMQR